MPYFTVVVQEQWDGTYVATVTAGTYANLNNTEELQDILTDCLSQNQAEGVVREYGLRYLRQDNRLFGYKNIAFVDMSMEQATLQKMMYSYLQIALAALLLLLGVSVVLSRWATRPVEKAWRQQRQFLSDASHELKTPLTVILSNAEMLQSAPPGRQARPMGGQHPLRGRTDEVPGGGDADTGPGGQHGPHRRDGGGLPHRRGGGLCPGL